MEGGGGGGGRKGVYNWKFMVYMYVYPTVLGS